MDYIDVSIYETANCVVHGPVLGTGRVVGAGYVTSVAEILLAHQSASVGVHDVTCSCDVYHWRHLWPLC